jgi:hypothetical protein
MSRASGRRGLVLALLLLAVLAGVLDLLRPESFLLQQWRRLNPHQTPLERAVKEFQRTREVPLPRSNRVYGEGTRRDMPSEQRSITA